MDGEVKTLDAETVKKEKLGFVPQTFSEDRSARKREIQIVGKNFASASGEPVTVTLPLSAVSHESNGDMTPELLSDLTETMDRLAALGDNVASDLSVTALTKNGADLSEELTESEHAAIENGWRLDWKSGGTSSHHTILPLATEKPDGLMSASDKEKLVSLGTPSVSLYRHRIRFTAYDPMYVMAFKEIYLPYELPLASVEDVISVLGDGSKWVSVPVSGSTEENSYNTVLCVEARIGPEMIKLIAMHFNHGDGTANRVNAEVDGVYDTVEKVI